MTEKSIKDMALDFVRYFIEQICEHKDKVEVTGEDDEQGCVISVIVDDSDMGRLIGKDGQTISALRTLLRTIGSRGQAKIKLKVLEPEA